jgi:peroxiredoxin
MEHAKQFLADNGVTFRNVLDSSKAGEDVMWKYETLIGMTAVPMSYLIDKEGKVVEAWYGIHGKETVRKALRLLY